MPHPRKPTQAQPEQGARVTNRQPRSLHLTTTLIFTVKPSLPSAIAGTIPRQAIFHPLHNPHIHPWPQASKPEQGVRDTNLELHLLPRVTRLHLLFGYRSPLTNLINFLIF